MKILPRIRTFLNLNEPSTRWIHNHSPILSQALLDRELELTAVSWDRSITALPRDGELVIVSMSPEMMRDARIWRPVATECSRLGHLCIERDNIPCMGGDVMGKEYERAVSRFLDAFIARHT